MTRGELSEHLALGRYLCCLVKQADKALAPYLQFVHMYFLLAGVSYTFGALDIVFHASQAKVPAIFIAISFTVSAFVCYFLLWLISHAGNKLRLAKEETKEALEDLYVHRSRTMKDEDKIEIDVLLGRIESVKIAPYNYFEVANSNLVGVVATVVTYIIVLLQFNQ